MLLGVMSPIRILLIDDHQIMRAGLRLMIEREPGLEVAGEAGGGAEALALAARERPAIILLDLDLGDESGLDLLPGLHAAAPEARVVVITGMRDPALHRRAVSLGALGMVHKEQAPESLVKAVRKVHAGEVWLDPSVTAQVLSELVRPPRAQPIGPEEAKIATLTDREREIVALIGAGLKNREIAARLFLSESTVRHHLTSIFGKLEVEGRSELIVYAYRRGLARPPGNQ